LDPAFSGDGVALLQFQDGGTWGRGGALDASGRIVVVGYSSPSPRLAFAIARYRGNGSLDPTFSGDGKRLFEFASNSGDDELHDVVVSNGRILAAGLTCSHASVCRVAVVRLLADGRLDTTFGNGGKVATQFPGSTQAYAEAIAVQPDGRILVTGAAQTGMIVARYRPDGSLDTTFSGDGRVTMDLVNRGLAIALLPTGKILITGEASTAGGDGRIPIVRLRSDGSPDPTFGGGDGVKVINAVVGGDFEESGIGLATLDTGRIVVGAQVTDAVSPTSDGDLAVLRLLPDGAPDTSFGGGDGIVFADFGDWEGTHCMLRQSDGRLLFGGESFVESPASITFAVFRLMANGSIDTTFGDQGVKRVDLGNEEEVGAFDLAVDSTGRIVATGSVYVESEGPRAVAPLGASFATVRLLAN